MRRRPLWTAPLTCWNPTCWLISFGPALACGSHPLFDRLMILLALWTWGQHVPTASSQKHAAEEQPVCQVFNMFSHDAPGQLDQTSTFSRAS